jgi:vitamin K-dependent gamma-carboxylase
MKQKQEASPREDRAISGKASQESLWGSCVLWLNRPADGGSLAVFRICIGLIMTLEAWSLCRPSASTNGAIPLQTFYTGQEVHFHFPYAGFHWLPILPTDWLKGTVAVLAIAGLLMAIGLLYRLMAILVFLCWGYLYAIERTRTYWMSYHYLELITTFLLIWMPAGNRFSVDAWISRFVRRKDRIPLAGVNAQKLRGSKPPVAISTRSRRLIDRFLPSEVTVPFWNLFLLRGQLVVAYFYSGVAKLNADWLLDAQPVRYYLAQARWIEDYRKFLTDGQMLRVKQVLQSPEFAYFLSWSGAAFDVGVGFLLLFRRTRIFGMVLILIFHSTNHFLIFNDIGWFPLLGILTALIFFEPDWPQRCWNWLRQPRITRPDLPWFITGAVLFPMIGASLGWKSRPATARASKNPTPHSQTAAFFAIIWLSLQTLVPLRHFVIPGDARFTWEGLSFSWRLKAEVYRCTPCELWLEDKTIIHRDDVGHNSIDWTRWHGERVEYRSLNPAHVVWSELPEVLVLLEPMVGQRILFNPFAGKSQGLLEAQSRTKIGQIWQEVYGHQPELVLRTVPAVNALASCGSALRARGFEVRTTEQAKQVLEKLLAVGEERELTSILRQSHPLALMGGSDPPTPFLLIEDPALSRNASTGKTQIVPETWRASSYTRSQRDESNLNVGGQPLVIFTDVSPFELRDKLPAACIFDSQAQADQLPRIWWNYLRELNYGQGMHLSMQPFLLREYANHIADLWQQTYGQRPIVHAETAVSLNFRPSQPIVDYRVDLASVPVSLFGHNTWIVQLKYPRIPPGSFQVP